MTVSALSSSVSALTATGMVTLLTPDATLTVPPLPVAPVMV